MLDIATDQEGHHRIYVINLRGRIDSITARDFEEFFEDMLKTGNRFFILDASRLEFVSSAGIAALVKFIRRLDAVGGATAVIRMNPEIRMLLEFFGLEDGLPEFERLEDAREYVSEKMRSGEVSLSIEKEKIMHPVQSDEERRQELRSRQARLDKSREAYARPLYSDEEQAHEAEAEDYDEYDDGEDYPELPPADEYEDPRVLKLPRAARREPAPPREYAERPRSEDYDRGRIARRRPHPRKYYVQGELDVEELRNRVEQTRGGGRTPRRRDEFEDELRQEGLREYRPLREKEGRDWTHSSYRRRSAPKKTAAEPRPQLYYRDAGLDGRPDRGPELSRPSLEPPQIHHKPEPRERPPLRRRSTPIRSAGQINREPGAEEREHELIEFAEPRVLVCESCSTHLRVYHSGRHLCANPACRVEFRVSEDGSVSYFEKL